MARTISWSNWIGDHKQTVVNSNIRTRSDLKILVQRIVDAGGKVRAYGSKHSMSAVAQPTSFAVSLAGMSGLLTNKWLKRSLPNVRTGQHLVRIKGGTRIKDLNAALFRRGLALPNMGSFDGQTIAGAISTATHGSGVLLGSIADMVVSLEMLVVTPTIRGEPRAKLLRIEPTNGITDPQAFRAARSSHDMDLVQDDTVFYAAVVSYGCMGAVVGVTLKVVDEFWLKEEYKAPSWSELRKSLRANTHGIPNRLKKVRHVDFLINVHETQLKNDTRANDPTTSLRFRSKTRKLRKPKHWRKPWPPMREKSLDELMDGLGQKAAGVDPDRRHPLAAAGIRGEMKSWARDKSPFAKKQSTSLSSIVLRRLRDDIFDGKAPKPPPKTITMEIAVPIENTIEAIDRVLEHIRNREASFVAPMGVRTVAASKHYLAPNYRRKVTYIEVPFVLPKRAKRREEVLEGTARRELKKIEEFLCYRDSHLKGRPHIGKLHNLNQDRVRELYPSFDRWLEVYERYNSFGTFDNAFTDQLGISQG